MTTPPAPVLASIVAAALDGSIGDGTQMLWRLPDDLKWFKQKTLGHHVLMGRKSFEALGKPLAGRTNVVITRQPNYQAPGAIVVSTIEAALELARRSGDPEPFITGGGEIYRATLDQVQRLYLTQVHHQFGALVTFPKIDLSQWREVSRSEHPADAKHAYAMTFLVLERR